MDGFGSINWWGFSPAINFWSYVSPEDAVKTGDGHIAGNVCRCFSQGLVTTKCASAKFSFRENSRTLNAEYRHKKAFKSRVSAFVNEYERHKGNNVPGFSEW